MEVSVRHICPKTVLLSCSLWLILFACGGSEPGGGQESATEEAAAAANGGASTDAVSIDPCSLVPLATWESATGQAGLELSRDGRDVCDVLDDANGRVAGSVSLLGMSVFEGTPNTFETETVPGVGDQAYWVSFGPGMLYVRNGDRAFSVMVNPHAVENNREVAEQLAMVVIGNL